MSVQSYFNFVLNDSVSCEMGWTEMRNVPFISPNPTFVLKQKSLTAIIILHGKKSWFYCNWFYSFSNTPDSTWNKSHSTEYSCTCSASEDIFYFTDDTRRNLKIQFTRRLGYNNTWGVNALLSCGVFCVKSQLWVTCEELFQNQLESGCTWNPPSHHVTLSKKKNVS